MSVVILHDPTIEHLAITDEALQDAREPLYRGCRTGLRQALSLLLFISEGSQIFTGRNFWIDDERLEGGVR